eukprot:s186_g6.t1
MSYGAGSLAWLERVDTLTRGRMASLVRRGWSAGLALKEARRESYLDWRSPSLVESQCDGAPLPKRRQDPLTESPAKVARPQVRTVSTAKGGKRLCKPWNYERGCPGNCGNLHLCDVRLESGGLPIASWGASSSCGQTSADTPLSSGSPSAARPEDADEVARTCLRRQDFSEQACLQVLRGCFDKPTENRRRSVLGRSGPVNYHILGFFASRTGIGLTEGTKNFPSVCKYLNMWLLHYFPQDLWCSIAISFNMVTQVHADQLNDPVIPNKCISLGPHTGGRLWLQDASGTVKFRDTKGKTYMGRQVDIHMKPCTFVPHQLHGSCLDPFRGERWVLVAYVPEAFSQARQAFEESLRDLAFPIGDHVQSRTVRILPELLDSPGARTVHCDRPSDATSWTPKRFCDNRSLAELLVAARPVVWRGAGDLLQVSWAQGPPGRWLLLDLCAGYSGLCIAALSTGLHCWALAVESDEQACKAARAVMPSGPSQDEIPVRFAEWVRGFADSLRDHAECCHLEVLVLFESFLDGEDHTCAQVSEWLDAQPIVVQAADCGWLSRHRAYWLRGNSRALSSTTCTAPQDWAWDKDEGGWTRLRYTGQKPVPSRVHFEGCFHPLQDPALVMKGEAAPFFEFAPAGAASGGALAMVTDSRYLPRDPSKEIADVQEWLGIDAARREIDKGFCSPPLTRAEVDKRFGHGGWRPLERFLIVQPDGKQRVIDNAKRTGHNDHVQMLETIFTVSVDFIACAVRDVLNLLSADGHDLPPTVSVDFIACAVRDVLNLLSADGHDLPPQVDSWLDVRVGTDDLPDAYRGHPVKQSQLNFSVVAVFVPNVGWRFVILWGLAYGLEAAVVAFNRFSTFGVSIARRCASAMAAAYFDDELSVEFVHGSCPSQMSLKQVFHLLGAPPQPAKSFPPAADRHYLGASVHIGDVFADREICIQPKFLTVRKVIAKLDQILESGILDRGGAGKLRGDLMWLFSSCSGFAAKSAGPLLARYQGGEDPALDDDARFVLSSLKELVNAAGPRRISVLGLPPTPLRIYTDASFEGGELRLGWIILRSHVCLAAGTTLVPNSVLDTWKPRHQQIFPGEALCVLVVPALHPKLLFQEDAIWFVDNQAALSAAIRGGCRETDVHEIAYAAATLRTRLSFRCWFEWVDRLGFSSLALLTLDFRDQNFLGMLAQATSWKATAMPASTLSQILLCLGHFHFAENDLAIDDAAASPDTASLARVRVLLRLELIASEIEEEKAGTRPCATAFAIFGPCTSLENFTPNCPVHGLMHLPGFVKMVVDTALFQRMRHIKQLGVCSLVFPGAKHDRFFHSIGTAHLAYNLMKDLRSNQPELCISDRDVVCVVLAALMHDLGHPAYSHMFETFMASIGHTSWTHEQASTVLVKEVLRSVNLSLLTKDAEGDDEQFIVELIDPPKKELNTFLNLGTLKEHWPSLMKGRPVQKAYMYEIVSNFRSGIDVDKMDYFRRDAYFLGIARQFDHHRYLKSLVVIKDHHGITTLSPPEKLKDDIRENLCELRKTLHRTAYQHKTVKKLESHMVDILKLMDQTIRVTGKSGKKMSISEAALSCDTVAYAKLTDMFVETRLLENEIPERNVMTWEVPTEQEEPGFKMPDVQSFVEETLKLSSRQVPRCELICVESKLHYGLGSEDPIKKVVFHDKEGKPRLFDVDYDANPLRQKLFLFWNPQSIDDPLHMNTLERLHHAATQHAASCGTTDVACIASEITSAELVQRRQLQTSKRKANDCFVCSLRARRTRSFLSEAWPWAVSEELRILAAQVLG